MKNQQNQRCTRSFSLANLFRRALPPGFETLQTFARHEELLLAPSNQSRVRAVLRAQRRRPYGHH